MILVRGQTQTDHTRKHHTDGTIHCLGYIFPSISSPQLPSSSITSITSAGSFRRAAIAHSRPSVCCCCCSKPRTFSSPLSHPPSITHYPLPTSPPLTPLFPSSCAVALLLLFTVPLQRNPSQDKPSSNIYQTKTTLPHSSSRLSSFTHFSISHLILLFLLQPLLLYPSALSVSHVTAPPLWGKTIA